jgi:hypothetical protein
MRRDTKDPKIAGHCDCRSPAVRNRYFRGKLLTVHDYQAEQRYLIQRRRLVNRAVLGWGVVSGFGVEQNERHLAIAPGVAFDCQGRELVLCETFRIGEADDVIWLQPGKCRLEAIDTPLPDGCYLLSAHYAECQIDGVRIDDGCGEVVCEPNHICEAVVFSLRADTGCPPFKVRDCTDLAPNPGQEPAEIPVDLPYIAPRGGRGVGNLCLDLPCHDDKAQGAGTARHKYQDSTCRCHFDPCCPPHLSTLGCCDIDFDAGVPLVYVTVSHDDCRLVFTELTQIIGCCDLTAIKDIGWRNWHNRPGIEIGRRAFFDMFVPSATGLAVQTDPEEEDDTDSRPYRDQPVYPPVDTFFWVCFTGPVQIASLTPDVMTMSLAQADSREAVWNVVLVPIIRLWCAPTTPGDPPGTTRGFRPLVQHEFWSGEINRGVSSGFRRRTFVEIRIHASAIVDWSGQALDGYSIGRHLPTGNGSPGGDFVSSWRVRRGGPEIPPLSDVPPALLA